MRVTVVLPDETEYEADAVYIVAKNEWIVEMLFRSGAASVSAPTLEEAVRKFSGELMELKHRYAKADWEKSGE